MVKSGIKFLYAGIRSPIEQTPISDEQHYSGNMTRKDVILKKLK